MFTDTHAHLSAPELATDLDLVIGRARENNVDRIVSIGSGYGIEKNRSAVEHTQLYKGIFATVGIHPHEAKSRDENSISMIKRLVKEGKVVALGEMGLDFFKEYSPRDVQREVFREQIKLSKDLNLPIVIHDRDAHAEILDILKEFVFTVPAGVFHCFSGDAEFAQTCVRMGFFISIPGVVTFKKAKTLASVVETIPLENLLLETDCPFLAPEPYRGKRNEPSYIPIIAQKIAEIKKVPLEQIGEITSGNACTLFGISRLEESVQNSMLTYEWKGNLYLNITNRCTNRCVFCPKQKGESFWDLDFKLPVEPSAEEIIERIQNHSGYNEVVFCGMGESLLRLNVVKKVGGWLKSKGVRVRVNTDGLANKVYGRNIAPELSGKIDAVSVSINAHDPVTYKKITRTPYGEQGWHEVLDFIAKIKAQGIDVAVSVVRHQGVDIESCQRLAEDTLGVPFRVRG